MVRMQERMGERERRKGDIEFAVTRLQRSATRRIGRPLSSCPFCLRTFPFYVARVTRANGMCIYLTDLACAKHFCARAFLRDLQSRAYLTSYLIGKFPGEIPRCFTNVMLSFAAEGELFFFQQLRARHFHEAVSFQECSYFCLM